MLLKNTKKNILINMDLFQYLMNKHPDGYLTKEETIKELLLDDLPHILKHKTNITCLDVMLIIEKDYDNV